MNFAHSTVHSYTLII